MLVTHGRELGLMFAKPSSKKQNLRSRKDRGPGVADIIRGQSNPEAGGTRLQGLGTRGKSRDAGKNSLESSESKARDCEDEAMQTSIAVSADAAERAGHRAGRQEQPPRVLDAISEDSLESDGDQEEGGHTSKQAAEELNIDEMTRTLDQTKQGKPEQPGDGWKHEDEEAARK